jgi:hypothetical protein
MKPTIRTSFEIGVLNDGGDEAVRSLLKSMPVRFLWLAAGPWPAEVAGKQNDPAIPAGLLSHVRDVSGRYGAAPRAGQMDRGDGSTWAWRTADTGQKSPITTEPGRAEYTSIRPRASRTLNNTSAVTPRRCPLVAVEGDERTTSASSSC